MADPWDHRLQMIEDMQKRAEGSKSELNDLLSCPFCRSLTFVKIHEVTDENNGFFGMWRIGCGCCGFHSFRESKAEATEIWNRAAR